MAGNQSFNVQDTDFSINAPIFNSSTPTPPYAVPNAQESGGFLDQYEGSRPRFMNPKNKPLIPCKGNTEGEMAKNIYLTEE